jgi:hypothetical protein
MSRIGAWLRDSLTDLQPEEATLLAFLRQRLRRQEGTN